MKFFDWAAKKRYLPLLSYFKTDAAGAEKLRDSPTGKRPLAPWPSLGGGRTGAPQKSW